MAIKDKAASVLARLLNKAREQGVAHSQLLMLFAQEEFIRRLALSRYADNADMQTKWHYFLRDTAIENIPFEKIMEGVSQFLGPVVEAMEKGEEYQALWKPQLGWNA